MLEELHHVVHSFKRDLSHSGTGKSDSGHGVGLAVCQPLVGCLHSDVVVIYGLTGLLDEVSKVCAHHLSWVVRFEGLEELLLDGVPVISS
jgi:hypothetical protein